MDKLHSAIRQDITGISLDATCKCARAELEILGLKLSNGKKMDMNSKWIKD